MKKSVKVLSAVIAVVMLIATMSVFAMATPIKYGLTADMIKSVHVEDFVISSDWAQEVDGKPYYSYSDIIWVDVELVNGDWLYSSYDGNYVTYEQINTPIVYTDEQATAPWGIGDHEITVSVLGVKTTATVTVVEAMDFYDSFFSEYNGFYYNIIEGESEAEEAIILTCDSKDETVTVPSEIEGKPVTEIWGLGWIADTAKKVIIPDSVKYLSNGIIETMGTPVLEEIVIGAGVAEMGEDLFWGDVDTVKTITVSENNETYVSVDNVIYTKDKSAVVMIAPAVKTVTLPKETHDIGMVLDSDAVLVFPADSEHYTTVDGVTYTKDMETVIYADRALKGKVKVADTVTSISGGAFSGCAGITDVVLPDSVTGIMYSSFLGCTSLANVNTPKNLTHIGVSAFQNTALTAVDFPAKLDYIGEYAYANTAVKSVKLPVVEEMDSHVFAYSDVESISAFAGVTSIVDYTFYGTKVTSVEIPDGVEFIGVGAFANSALKSVDLTGVTEIASRAFANTQLEKLVIPESVESVVDAFAGCDKLTDVTLNKKLVSLYGTFRGCTALKEITVPANIKSLYATFAGCTSLEKINFEGPITLYETALMHCPLTKTDLSKVTGKIDQWAIAYNPGITVEIPATVTELAYASFAGSDSLAYIAIPKSVNGIHPYAFSGCKNLTHVFYEGTEAEWKALASGRDDDVLTKAVTHYNTGAEVKVETTGDCTVDRKATYICTICNEVLAKDVELEASAHVWGEYVNDNNATTQKDATKTATCKECGAKDVVSIPGTKLAMQDSTKVFKDVKAGKWYTDAVDYAYSNGFIKGMEKDEFGLQTTLTRGMFVTILARIAGVDTSSAANKAATTKFTDVKAGKYYAAAVQWASENNVVAGMSKTEFAPNSDITREQLCRMVSNFCKALGITLPETREAITFKDAASISKWAKASVAACQKAGIITGYKNGDGFDFKPQANATRAEAAQILYVFHKDIISK